MAKFNKENIQSRGRLIRLAFSKKEYMIFTKDLSWGRFSDNELLDEVSTVASALRDKVDEVIKNPASKMEKYFDKNFKEALERLSK